MCLLLFSTSPVASDTANSHMSDAAVSSSGAVVEDAKSGPKAPKKRKAMVKQLSSNSTSSVFTSTSSQSGGALRSSSTPDDLDAALTQSTDDEGMDPLGASGSSSKRGSADTAGKSLECGYATLFPLFQPCGEAYPDLIIPRPFQWIGAVYRKHGISSLY